MGCVLLCEVPLQRNGVPPRVVTRQSVDSDEVELASYYDPWLKAYQMDVADTNGFHRAIHRREKAGLVCLFDLVCAACACEGTADNK